MQTGVYKHYRGGLYQVLGVAEHTETKEKMVVYVSLTGADLPGPRMRVRPMNGPEGFLTPVPAPQSSVRPAPPIERFVYIGDEISEHS